MKGKSIGLILGGLAAISGMAFASSCPSVEQISPTLKNFFGLPQIKVLQVSADKYFKGLCDVVAEINDNKFILYIDQSGRYIILGPRNSLAQIVDMKTKENITLEQLLNFELKTNKLPVKKVQELDKYVAFTYGHGGKVIYLFTDPECPFCHRIEPILKKWADEGKIQVKVILLPLWFHPHAHQKAVAIVCKNIGWKGLTNEYWNKQRMEKLNQWQCEKGEKLIEQSLKIGQKFGVQGTPTIITESGEKIEGAYPPQVLKKALGIK
jgi:thiol:disulfide interchange protein DsbC